MNPETTLNYLMAIIAFLVFCAMLACAAAFWMLYRDMKAKRDLNRRLRESAQKEIDRW